MNKPAARSVIAIVDDDRSVRDAVDNVLKSAGHEALACASAEAFLACGRLDAVACVVLDIELQGISGLELCQLMRARQMTIPVLFISGHGDAATRALALRAGGRAFLCKPIDADTLLDCIDAALSGR